MKRVSLSSLKSFALSGAAFLFALSASATDPVMLKRVDVSPQKGSTDFILHTDSAPTFQSFSRKNPHMLIVDLVDADSAVDAVKNPGGVVEAVSIKQHDGQGGTKVARLTVKFKREVRYQVDAETDQVRVRIFDDDTRGKKAANKAASARTGNTPVNLAAAGEMGRATDDGSGGGDGAKMTFVGFKNTSGKSRVFARMSEKNAKYEVKKEGPNIVVLEIQGTIPLRNNKNHLDARFFESPVKVITPSEVDGATPTIRITIEMNEGQSAPYEAKREGREIAIYFKK